MIRGLRNKSFHLIVVIELHKSRVNLNIRFRENLAL